MIRVSTELEKKLNNKFFGIGAEDLLNFKKRRYIKVLLNTFDHYLNEKEADDLIISYAFIENNNKIQLNKYLYEEEKFINLYRFLYSKYNIFYCKCINESFSQFYHFSSLNELIQRVKNDLREKEFIKLCIEDLSIFIKGNFDLNQVVYYLRDSQFVVFEKYVRQMGLFLLK